MTWEKVETTDGYTFWKTYDFGIVLFNVTSTGENPGKVTSHYRSVDAAKRSVGLLPALTNNPLAGVTAFRLGC